MPAAKYPLARGCPQLLVGYVAASSHNARGLCSSSAAVSCLLQPIQTASQVVMLAQKRLQLGCNLKVDHIECAF